MGKSLNGEELGKGICQRKDGRYEYRKSINGKRKTYYSNNIDEIYQYKEQVEALINENKNAIAVINNNKNKIGYVYFVSDGEYCKIGQTSDINQRIRDLQVASSRKLRLMSFISTPDCVNVEKQLHNLR